ncbi:transmembrane protein 30C [Polypterus senegalus]|uniref:transmembrane protein 30C n=1 Tax=Polypterus senegalus TaxID=55291 RepID=UPI0019659E54|nr:transmembrane protein 30C [Polypterus senegalus]
MASKATSPKPVPFAKRPDNSAFKQQKLPAWYPALTAVTVLPFFFLTGLACVLIGIWLFLTAAGIKQITVDYTEGGTCSLCFDLRKDRSQSLNSCECNVDFSLNENFTGDVFMYYGLTNFHQNIRFYMDSRDDAQLTGNENNLKCCPTFIMRKNQTFERMIPDDMNAEMFLANDMKILLSADPSETTLPKNCIFKAACPEVSPYKHVIPSGIGLVHTPPRFVAPRFFTKSSQSPFQLNRATTAKQGDGVMTKASVNEEELSTPKRLYSGKKQSGSYIHRYSSNKSQLTSHSPKEDRLDAAERKSFNSQNISRQDRHLNRSLKMKRTSQLPVHGLNFTRPSDIFKGMQGYECTEADMEFVHQMKNESSLKQLKEKYKSLQKRLKDEHQSCELLMAKNEKVQNDIFKLKGDKIKIVQLSRAFAVNYFNNQSKASLTAGDEALEICVDHVIKVCKQEELELEILEKQLRHKEDQLRLKKFQQKENRSKRMLFSNMKTSLQQTILSEKEHVKSLEKNLISLQKTLNERQEQLDDLKRQKRDLQRNMKHDKPDMKIKVDFARIDRRVNCIAKRREIFLERQKILARLKLLI